MEQRGEGPLAAHKETVSDPARCELAKRWITHFYRCRGGVLLVELSLNSSVKDEWHAWGWLARLI